MMNPRYRRAIDHAVECRDEDPVARVFLMRYEGMGLQEAADRLLMTREGYRAAEVRFIAEANR